MGGAVGLKGTDGELYLEAVKRGARPEAPRRALRFIMRCAELGIFNESSLAVVSAASIMGCNYLQSISDKIKCSVLCLDIPKSDRTTAEDTKEVVRKFVELGVDVIIFVGGDGTARDVIDVTKGEIPVLGIPAGVKMYSGCFAVSPEVAADLLKLFLEGEAEIGHAEVLDIDEYSYSLLDKLVTRKYGITLTIRHPYLTSASKETYSSDESEKEGIADYFVEEYLKSDGLYLLGPGSTVMCIAKKLGVPKTLLGVDAVYGNTLVAKDIAEREILELIRRYNDVYIVVTVIGGQGFIFGRGNKQFTPNVLKNVHKNHIYVVATKAKLRRLKYLLVETGDPSLDEELSGFWRVICGYREETVVRVLPASRLHKYIGT